MLAPRRAAKLGCPTVLPRNATRDCSYLAALAIAAFVLAGCTPGIGDRCTLSTDCSVQGNRLCDTSQPNGYCTLTPCTANSCPDNAACVEIGASVPGCAYDDYAAPSRVGTSMCLKTCNSDSDCRQSDGYSCASPSGPGSSNVILDTNQSEHVCLIASPPASLADGGGSSPGFVDAQVCSSGRLDASPLEASVSTVVVSEAGADGGAGDAGAAALDAAMEDATFDATADSGGDDGGVDSTLVADAGTDSTVDDGGAATTVGDSASE